MFLSLRSSLCLLSLLLFGTSGCTLVGLGKGISTPHYVDVQTPREVAVGETVRVHVIRARERTDWSPDDPTVEGVYGGIEESVILVGSRSLPMREVTMIEVRRGSHWLTGLLVGAALDAAATILIVSAASGTGPNLEIALH